MNTPDPMNTQKRRQCTATNRQGKRCGRSPIVGGTVCDRHGGKAPQVQRKARLRLLELVDPAIATLAREMGKAESSRDRQSAANSILDRAGYGRATKIEGVDARELLAERLIAMREAKLAEEEESEEDDVQGE